jgi:MYXO-CTERM domain-containing protein
MNSQFPFKKPGTPAGAGLGGLSLLLFRRRRQ